MRKILRIAIMPVIYFGAVLVMLLDAALSKMAEPPLWWLPLFAAVAALGGVLLGARLPQVLITFAVIVAIFPMGVLYLIGIGSRLSPAQTLSIMTVGPELTDWLMILSPLFAAAATAVVAGRLLKTPVNPS